MSYRGTRGGRAARRKAHKNEKQRRYVDALVREWLIDHPPRVVDPMESGAWIEIGPGMEPIYEVKFSCTPRPLHPIVQVPIPEPFGAQRIETTFKASHPLRMISMRPIRMGMSCGGARLSWWNWEPTEGSWDREVEADIYRLARKTLAFMNRTRGIVALLALRDGETCYEFGTDPQTIASWWDETMDALEAWMGKVKCRYLIPSKKPWGMIEPEEMIR